MDYQDVVKDEFIPRCMAALNQLRADLITAGAKPGDVVVEMPDTNDLRFAFRATGKGNKTITGYIELSTLGPAGSCDLYALARCQRQRNHPQLYARQCPGLQRRRGLDGAPQ